MSDALAVDRQATLGRLAPRILHRLNNPMTLLTANLAWLEQRLVAGDGGGELAEEGDEVVEDCRAALADMQKVIAAVGEFVGADTHVRPTSLRRCLRTAAVLAELHGRYVAALDLQDGAEDVAPLVAEADLCHLLILVLLHVMARPVQLGPVRVQLRVTGEVGVLHIEDLRVASEDNVGELAEGAGGLDLEELTAKAQGLGVDLTAEGTSLVLRVEGERA